MVFGRVKLETFFTCDRGEIIFRKLHIGILQESINGGQKGVRHGATVLYQNVVW